MHRRYLQWYRNITKYLSNHHTTKQDKHPKTLTNAYTLLKHYRATHKVEQSFTSDKVTFTKAGNKGVADMDKIK